MRLKSWSSSIGSILSLGLLSVIVYAASLHLRSVGGKDDLRLREVTVDVLNGGVSKRSDDDPIARSGKEGGSTQDEVEAILLKVEPEFQEQCRKILEGKSKSFSQIYQDWFLYHNFFSHVPYGAGFYVDIGANHPLAHSNTLFFDKCLGWKGLCWEPNPALHPLFANRSCSLVPHCVHQEETEVGFNFGSGHDQNAHILPVGHAASDVNIKCRPLQAVLEEHNISRIDFVSLDVEGAELHAIRCFPFDQWKIKVWVVETDLHDNYIDYFFIRARYSKVAELLYRNHYFRHAGRIIDSVYVRNEQILKYPPMTGFDSDTWENDCSKEDKKWNNCDSVNGLPVFEIREINATTGEVYHSCPNQIDPFNRLPNLPVGHGIP